MGRVGRGAMTCLLLDCPGGHKRRGFLEFERYTKNRPRKEQRMAQKLSSAENGQAWVDGPLHWSRWRWEPLVMSYFLEKDSLCSDWVGILWLSFGGLPSWWFVIFYFSLCQKAWSEKFYLGKSCESVPTDRGETRIGSPKRKKSLKDSTFGSFLPTDRTQLTMAVVRWRFVGGGATCCLTAQWLLPPNQGGAFEDGFGGMATREGETFKNS